MSWSIETLSKEDSTPSSSSRAITKIVADLFDDFDASNVVFIVHNPGHLLKGKRYIYAHTNILATTSNYFKMSAYFFPTVLPC